MHRVLRVLLLAAVVCAMVGLVVATATDEERTAGAMQPSAAPSRSPSLLQRAHLSNRASHASVQKSKRAGTALSAFYHSTRELYDEIKKLGETCPHLAVSWEAATGAGTKNAHKSLMAVRVNLGGTPKPERALFIFGEHARELISSETGLEFMRRLCDPAQRQTKFLDVESTVADILATTEFLIYPNANPSGRRITERGNYCNRVNDRGVDLNRNWGEHWSSASQHPDTYPGTKAWSEAEVLILARAATSFKPTIFISIHSGSLHMLSPFAFKAGIGGEPAASVSAIDPPGLAVHASAPAVDTQGGQGLKPVISMLHQVNKDFCQCAVGAAGKELGYLSPGTCLDYIYNRLGTRYSFALEIFEGSRFANGKGAALIESDVSAAAAAHAKPDSDFFAAQSAHLSSLPSYPLPLSDSDDASHVSLLEHGVAVNDGDIPDRGVLFPRARRGNPSKCLAGFNPTTKDMYEATVDHWSRALLAFVEKIQKSRAAAAAAVEANTE